jgi:hypothetical protein
VHLRTDILEDLDRDLWENVELDQPSKTPEPAEVTARLGGLLERLERVVEESG